MKTFVFYTVARLALFAVAFGLIWLVFGHWLDWSSVSILYTAVIALLLSSVAALFVLGSLRDDFAAHVSARADRAKAAFDAMRAAEDTDQPSDGPEQVDGPQRADGAQQ